jgi:mitochondrial splicing suppressor protein 51
VGSAVAEAIGQLGMIGSTPERQPRCDRTIQLRKSRLIRWHQITTTKAAMAPPTDAAVRSALSSLCARCPTTLGNRGRQANGLVQASHRSLHTPARSRSHLLRPSTTTPSSLATIGRLPAGSRPITGLVRKLFGGGEATAEPAQDIQETQTKPQDDSVRQKRVLAEDDLFHSFTESPIPEIRQRAAYIRQHASCPHPQHRNGLPKRVNFECPDCGIPVYCSKEHWASHYEQHLEVCDTLRQINEDDHDLRSGRWFPEFEYAGPQVEDSLVNMTNWDTFLYTRAFEAINSDRSMRQATRLLTYPITIASILHELSPHITKDKGRLTTEGLKSFSGTSMAT